MNLHLKTVFQQALQHQHYSRPVSIVGGFRVDLIPVGVDPVGPAHDLRTLEAICVHDKQLDGSSGDQAPPRHGTDRHGALVREELNGGHFEFRSLNRLRENGDRNER
jgi:hypothetical protein